MEKKNKQLGGEDGPRFMDHNDLATIVDIRILQNS